MLWIKRNLLFVISVAVGLLLTGYCAWLLYSSLSDNAGVSQDYQATLSSLQEIQQKSPFPSTENIQAAKADQNRVRLFLNDFKKRFAPFPPPPMEDDKGFKTRLGATLIRFRAEATNAGVQLPIADYAFAFSGLMGKLNYPPGSVEPWMQQLEHISTILDILYHAKINYLAGLQRVPVSPDDSGPDCLAATTVTNQWGIVTPYKITFRGFSTEIAAVLEGFARSSNCFIIKAINVVPDKTALAAEGQPLAQQTMTAAYAPAPQYQNSELRSEGRLGRIGGLRPPAAAPTSVAAGASVAAISSSPVTILSENPLLVTVSVDVVQLKASER